MTAPAKRQPIPFGKYLLLDRINIGGMAEVWRGKDFGVAGFERLVAIKRILPNIAEDEEFITMFIDEAKITVQLTHANIAQVYELGQIANNYFIAMEYIPGKDMRAIFDRCRKKGEPAPVPLVCYVVAKMCEGLDYAHRKKDGMGRDMNIVHRDISPQNVLVSYEGEVKVIDFGIAKAAGKANKTQAGILKGKFAYMSPEQIRGLPLDRRSDVFAIGICLYEMLTGERLFVGDSDFSVLEKVRKAEVLPPSTYNRRIPEALERIVLKALAKDVDERYQYANEVADDLQRFLITSDSIFSRKDLMQYMKSTFAEEVEREKLRIQEYADVKPSEGMLAALEMGYANAGAQSANANDRASAAANGGGAPVPMGGPAAPRTNHGTMPVVNAPRQTSTQIPTVAPAAPPPRMTSTQMPAVAPVSPPVLGAPTLPPVPVTPSTPQVPRRSPTVAAMPKLTATVPVNTQKQNEEAGATLLVESNSFFGQEPDDEGAEGYTEPGMKPAALLASIGGLGPVRNAPNAAALPQNARGPALGDPLEDGGATGIISPPTLSPATESGEIAQTILGTASRFEAEPDPTPAPQPRRPSRAHVALPRNARGEGGPPVLAPAEDEEAPTTSGLHEGSGTQDESEEEEDFTSPQRPSMRPTTPVPALAEKGAGQSLTKILAVVAVALLLVVSGVGVVMLRGPGEGFLYVEVPAELHGKARLTINGEDLGTNVSWPYFQKVKAGPTAVLILAEGYEPVVKSVEVVKGTDITRVVPSFEKR